MTLTDINKSEFQKAMTENYDAIHLLKLKYLAAQLREAELDDLFDATYNEVLQEHEFYVDVDKEGMAERYDVNVGDKIVNESNSFLMSESDFERYLKLAVKKQFALGYVTEDGTYNEGFNGLKIKMNAQRELVYFFISLLPDEMQKVFTSAMRNVTHQQKLIDLIMNV